MSGEALNLLGVDGAQQSPHFVSISSLQPEVYVHLLRNSKCRQIWLILKYLQLIQEEISSEHEYENTKVTACLLRLLVLKSKQSTDRHSDQSTPNQTA